MPSIDFPGEYFCRGCEKYFDLTLLPKPLDVVKELVDQEKCICGTLDFACKTCLKCGHSTVCCKEQCCKTPRTEERTTPYSELHSCGCSKVVCVEHLKLPPKAGKPSDLNSQKASVESAKKKPTLPSCGLGCETCHPPKSGIDEFFRGLIKAKPPKAEEPDCVWVDVPNTPSCQNLQECQTHGEVRCKPFSSSTAREEIKKCSNAKAKRATAHRCHDAIRTYGLSTICRDCGLPISEPSELLELLDDTLTTAKEYTDDECRHLRDCLAGNDVEQRKWRKALLDFIAELFYKASPYAGQPPALPSYIAAPLEELRRRFA